MAFPSEEAMAEFGQLFNFEQAASSSQAHRGKTVVSPQFTARGPEHSFIPQQSQQTFQPPSHKYELYSQHTSLAPGAYSVQQKKQTPVNSLTLSGSNASGLDMVDVDANSYGGMDMDFPDMFDTNPVAGFVDPSSVGAGSDAGDLSPATRPVQRLWPGMHQQHAAAKEQQKKFQQQKLLEQQRRQGGQQQPQFGAQQQFDQQRRNSQPRKKTSDPIVEERISQILRTMRQSHMQPAHSSTPQPSMAQSAKQKKDEDDMDEDERLLASEEGKKLSSKERRQLRNKVSARAFRSRRKEYISQLEGELQGKQSEVDEARFENEALRAENAQLTDLAHMLLGHPAFNSVLEDLAARGGKVPLVPSQPGQHRAPLSRESRPAPQPPVNSSADFATPMDAWSTDLGAPDFNFNPSVFTVTQLPEPLSQAPILDEKIRQELDAFSTPADASKLDYPQIQRFSTKVDSILSLSGTTCDPCDPVHRSPYSDCRTVSTLEENISELVKGLAGKACEHIELISIEHMKVREETLERRFEILCQSLDTVCLRVENTISR